MPSVSSDARVIARAPGYAQRRTSVSIDGAGSVNNAEIKLPKEFRVTGKVTDPDGRPLEGAVVKSFMTSYHNKAATDARGIYVLKHLDPGRPRHSVFARHENFVESNANVATQGNEVRQDFQLGRGVRVSGRVIDADGKALEGASLYIGFSPSAYNRLDALAKDGGRFVFPVVGPGEQTLFAKRAGYAPIRTPILVPKGEDELSGIDVVLSRGRTISGRVITPDGKPAKGVRVSWRHQREYTSQTARLDAEGRFEGRHLPYNGVDAELWGERIERLNHNIADGKDDVRDLVITVQPSGMLAGRVVDARTGEPLRSFLVRIVSAKREQGDTWGSGYSATWSREGHRFSDTDGYWSTDDEQLTVGAPYGIEISAQGYATQTNRRILAEVTPKKDAVVFEMAPGATLVGTIIDGLTRKPIHRAVVKLFDEKNPIRIHNTDDVHGRKMATTNAAGHFTIADLPAQPVKLQITHPDYAPHEHGPVEVPSGTEVRAGEIALTTGGGIVGVVADDDGRPLPGASVEARAKGRTWQAKADAEGRFRIDKLAAGTYSVWRMLPDASGAGWRWVRATFRTNVTVKVGEATEVRLAPQGSATVRGTIVFEGELPDDLHIELVPQGESKAPHRWIAVKDKAFTARRVAPGAYLVRCNHHVRTSGSNRLRSWSGKLNIELVEGDVKNVELTVEQR